MRLLAFLLIAVAIIPVSCRQDCGCVPPPHTSMNWKVVSVYGGIGGTQQPLTAAQKNHILNIRSDGSFTCINTITGSSFEGGITMSNFTSIYGDRQRLTFVPEIPMIDSEYIILVDKTNTVMLMGDNVVDGYMTRFEPAQ